MGALQLAIDTAARLRVCRDAGVSASPELLADALRCLETIVDDTSRRKRRNVLIRQAALLLPQTSAHARAGRLASEAKVLARMWHLPSWRQSPEQPATPREYLIAAAAVAELPASQRQFHRVLSEGH